MRLVLLFSSKNFPSAFEHLNRFSTVIVKKFNRKNHSHKRTYLFTLVRTYEDGSYAPFNKSIRRKTDLCGQFEESESIIFNSSIFLRTGYSYKANKSVIRTGKRLAYQLEWWKKDQKVIYSVSAVSKSDFEMHTNTPWIKTIRLLTDGVIKMARGILNLPSTISPCTYWFTENIF